MNHQEKRPVVKNTSKYEKLIINCNHLEQINKSIELNKSYFYCFKCNHIILLYNNKTYCVHRCKVKDEENENNNYFYQIEYDPILIIKTMIKRQEEQNKDINDKLFFNFLNDENREYNNEKKSDINNINDNNELNINESNNHRGKIKLTKLIFDEDNCENYCEYRNKILMYINNLCSKLKYNDNSFYITLYLADTYLSRIITNDITEKELFLVILGFFLISSKYIEDDIFEPEFEIFCNFEKKFEPLTIDEIRTSEIQCLTLISHNLYIYTVYDWINILLYKRNRKNL